MEIRVTGKYMLFPVNERAKVKTVEIYYPNEEYINLLVRLDPEKPQYYLPYRLRCEVGEILNITPSINFVPTFSDKMPKPNYLSDPYRPRLHFSAPYGWINDPNGLIYRKGEYHLFYQHNPVDTCWSCAMHWGHAVSRDLFHWDDLGDAIYPDKAGWAFSGCAVAPDGDNGDLILIYTGVGNENTQQMVHSSDGRSFIHDGTVLGRVEDSTRDPKIVRYEPDDKFIMSLFLGDNRYGIYDSRDLKKWNLLQEITLPGDAECPGFFPLFVNEDKNREKWILIGASDKYIIGSFNGTRFTPETEVGSLSAGYGYAAQNFYDAPEGECIRLYWNRYTIPGEPFSGQMGTPGILRLKDNHKDGMYLTLEPVHELENLYVDKPVFLSDAEGECNIDVAPYRIDAVLTPGESDIIELYIFGMIIEFSIKDMKVKNRNTSARFTMTEGKISVTVIVDRLGCELYIDEGREYIIFGDTLDRLLPFFKWKGAKECRITLQKLADIYEKSDT